MSDFDQSFDEVFQDKLREHEVSPPASVWENIESTRSYGHVVANRISINWRTFGTMLLILLGGGSSAILFGGEEKLQNTPNSQFAATAIEEKKDIKAPISAQAEETKKASKAFPNTVQAFQIENQKVTAEEYLMPTSDLFASLEQAAFSKPSISSDPHLNALISEFDGWESAKPVSFVRFYELDPLEQKGILKKELNPSVQGEVMDYDYVKYEIEKKGFWDRSSILIAFTPQNITKTMAADYNLSSSYLRHRASSEQTRMAYTLEANLHYELKNHRFIETGINFTQIYEEMSFKGEKRFSNQYDFIEIPLLLGYEDRNSKWGYHVKGGFGIQIYNRYKGYIYKRHQEGEEPAPVQNTTGGGQYRLRSTDAVKNIITNNHSLSKNQDPDQVLDLSNSNENPYKTSGVVNIHLAAGLTYFHSIKTSFVMTPYYRRSINSITKENALFTERIQYMGISLGTRIKF